jgi:hypothetical protein
MRNLNIHLGLRPGIDTKIDGITTTTDRSSVQFMVPAHGRYADVTEIVRHFARTREPFQVSNETFGVDPYRGKRKHLRVTIVRPDGDQLERSWEEGDMARL